MFYSKTWQDFIFTSIVWCAVSIVISIFIWLVGDLILKGFSHLSFNFLISEPENAGREGGINSILISTLLIVGIALTVTIPVGLLTAIYLYEYISHNGQHANSIHISLDMLAGMPSIIFGLFGNAFFCIFLHLGFSILSGGLTLACMMLPLFVRATESGLSAVPIEWRQGGAALGMRSISILWNIVLPAATPAITAGIMLSTGRALAETAALIFTSGYVDRMPSSVMDSGRSLAVHIYDLSMNVTGGDTAAYASALTLIIVLMIISLVASGLIDRFLARKIIRV